MGYYDEFTCHATLTGCYQCNPYAKKNVGYHGRWDGGGGSIFITCVALGGCLD